jgi:SAM-dependent methyltransferase
MTLALLEAGLDVVSVDASPEFVALLAERVASRAPDRIAPVEVGDLHALRFPDRSFDGVVCGEVLEHLDDDAGALAEFTRVLAPGGLVVVSVPANPWRYDWVDAWAGHRRRYSVEDLETRMHGAGLVDVRVTSWGFPFTGLYHRHVYRPLLRRRLARGATPPTGGGRASQVAGRGLRAILEIDSVFQGRFPGWFGLIASARRPPDADAT